MATKESKRKQPEDSTDESDDSSPESPPPSPKAVKKAVKAPKEKKEDKVPPKKRQPKKKIEEEHDETEYTAPPISSLKTFPVLGDLEPPMTLAKTPYSLHSALTKKSNGDPHVVYQCGICGAPTEANGTALKCTAPDKDGIPSHKLAFYVTTNFMRSMDAYGLWKQPNEKSELRHMLYVPCKICCKMRCDIMNNPKFSGASHQIVMSCMCTKNRVSMWLKAQPMNDTDKKMRSYWLNEEAYAILLAEKNPPKDKEDKLTPDQVLKRQQLLDSMAYTD